MDQDLALPEKIWTLQHVKTGEGAEFLIGKYL